MGIFTCVKVTSYFIEIFLVKSSFKEHKRDISLLYLRQFIDENILVRKRECMYIYLFAVLVFIMLIPILYFIPTVFSLKGKVGFASIALCFSLLSIFAKAQYSWWIVGVLLLLLLVVTSYLIDQWFASLFFETIDSNEEAIDNPVDINKKVKIEINNDSEGLVEQNEKGDMKSEEKLSSNDELEDLAGQKSTFLATFRDEAAATKEVEMDKEQLLASEKEGIEIIVENETKPMTIAMEDLSEAFIHQQEKPSTVIEEMSADNKIEEIETDTSVMDPVKEDEEELEEWLEKVSLEDIDVEESDKRSK
jgi:membrane protein implicated in regulation of membrane protease activity